MRLIERRIEYEVLLYQGDMGIAIPKHFEFGQQKLVKSGICL